MDENRAQKHKKHTLTSPSQYANLYQSGTELISDFQRASSTSSPKSLRMQLDRPPTNQSNELCDTSVASILVVYEKGRGLKPAVL